MHDYVQFNSIQLFLSDHGRKRPWMREVVCFCGHLRTVYSVTHATKK